MVTIWFQSSNQTPKAITMKTLIILTSIGLAALVACLVISSITTPPGWFIIMAASIDILTLILFVITIYVSIKEGRWD